MATFRCPDCNTLLWGGTATCLRCGAEQEHPGDSTLATVLAPGGGTPEAAPEPQAEPEGVDEAPPAEAAALVGVAAPADEPASDEAAAPADQTAAKLVASADEVPEVAAPDGDESPAAAPPLPTTPWSAGDRPGLRSLEPEVTERPQRVLALVIGLALVLIVTAVLVAVLHGH